MRIALIALLWLGCGGSSADQCEKNSDCPSGQLCCLVWGVGGPSTGHNQCEVGSRCPGNL